MIDFENIWKIVLQIGSISGIIVLVYTIWQSKRRNAGFKFGFRASSREIFKKDSLEYCRLNYDGYVRNKSSEQNSLTAINLVVWGDKKRSKTLSFGHSPILIFDVGEGKGLKIPISFSSKGARHLQIKFEIPLTGTHDEKLIKEMETLKNSPFLALPKYDYRLIFEDVNENLFDDMGKLRSREEIDLWWTLPNTFNKLKEGNFIPFVSHYLRLQLTRIIFRVRRVFFYFGL